MKNVKLMFNMKINKDYTKIKLRDFRHNLTELRDSLEAGEVYQVTDRGVPFAYFIPVQYDVKVKKRRSKGDEPLGEILTNLIGAFELKEEIKDDPYYKKLYRKELEKKYLRKK